MSLVSLARKLQSGQTAKPDVPVRLSMEHLEDRTTPSASLITTTTAFAGANAPVQILGSSDDGQQILVQSTATNLISGEISTPGTNNLYYFNFATGQRSLVTAAAANPAQNITAGTRGLGAEVSTPGVQLKAVISGDGKSVAFESAVNAPKFDPSLGLAADDGGVDVFVWNASTQTTQLVSYNKVKLALGATSNVSNPAISRDGGTVAFVVTFGPNDSAYYAFDNKYLAGKKGTVIDEGPSGPNLYSAIVGQVPRLVTYYFSDFNTLDPTVTGGTFYVPFSDISVDPLGRYMSAEGLSYAVMSGGVRTRFSQFGNITVTGKDAYRFTFAGVGLNPPGTLNFDAVTTTANGDFVGFGVSSTVFDPVTNQFVFSQSNFGNVTNVILAADRSDTILYATATKDVTSTTSDFTTNPPTLITTNVSGDIVPNYVNNNGGKEDLYIAVRDSSLTATGAYVSSLVSSPDGVNGANAALNLTPGNYQISNDGRFVTFTTAATNIVPGLNDTNNAVDVFQYDRLKTTASKNRAISVRASNSNQTGNGASQFPVTTTDGFTVAYQSLATNLTGVPDTNTVADIYVRDVSGNATAVASSVPGNLSTANGASTTPVFGGSTQTGRLYFSSTATNLDRNATALDGTAQIFKVQTPLTSNSSPRTFAYSGGPAGYVSIGSLDIDGNVVVGTKIQPFANYTGEIRVASADVNADGVPDLIAGAGAGGGPRVKIIDGSTGATLDDFFAFESSFTGGVYVAAGDLNGDGRAELIVGAGETGGPRVQVYNTRTKALIVDTFAYESSSRTGVHVAAGDFNADGKQELMISPGLGGGPRVRVFEGGSIPQMNVVADFFAFDSSQRAGVYLSAGDFDNDGKSDILVGTGPGVTSQVRIYNSSNLLLRDPNSPITFLDFQPFGTNNTDGARPLLRNIQGGVKADLLVAAASNYPAIKSFAGNSFGADSASPAELETFDPFNSIFSTFGAWVG